MQSDLDALLKKRWPSVRGRHLFPELPYPRWTEEEERGALEMKGKQISLSKEFVSEISSMLHPSDTLEALLDHAISHYLYCPWDLSTHLKLYAEAKKVLKDKHMAQRATDYFMDVVADTYCVSQRESGLPKLYRNLNRGIMDEAIHSLYQRIWGVDLGVEGYEDLARTLSRLPYLDRSRWKESVRRFAKAVKSILEMEERFGVSDKENPMGSHNVQQYSPQEIDKSLKELALDATNPEEFKDLIHDFEDELIEATQASTGAMGLGPGQELDADTLYYMKLAENYSLPIRKTPMEKSGFFAPMVVQMVSIGEEVGELSEMFKKINSFYQEYVETFLGRFTSMFEPIMLVFMGVIIGIMIVGMFLPIFQITQIGTGG